MQSRRGPIQVTRARALQDLRAAIALTEQAPDGSSVVCLGLGTAQSLLRATEPWARQITESDEAEQWCEREELIYLQTQDGSWVLARLLPTGIGQILLGPGWEDPQHALLATWRHCGAKGAEQAVTA